MEKEEAAAPAAEEYDRSYITAFRFLDWYYFHVNYDENKEGFLGGMLGAMSPDNGIIEGIPDIAFYSKWVDTVNENSHNCSCLDCFVKYAEFYIREFDFDFLIPVLEYLKCEPGKNKFIEIQNEILNSPCA